MKTVSKLVISVFLLIQISITGSACNAQQKTNVIKPMSVAEAIELNRGSIVQLSYRSTRESSPTVLGSGFVVSKGHVVTALHVLNAPGVSREQLMIALPYPYSEKMRGLYEDVKFKVIEEDAAHDIALLRYELTSPASTINGKSIEVPASIAKLDAERTKDGDQIVSSGYPLYSQILVSNVGWIASSWDVSTSEFKNGFAAGVPNFSDSYLLSLTVNHGNSGGPIYSVETGKVIGVCVQVKLAQVEGAGAQPLGYNAGIAVAVPSKYVIDLLKKQNLKIN